MVAPLVRLSSPRCAAEFCLVAAAGTIHDMLVATLGANAGGSVGFQMAKP
jgi:hypothetical protein